MKSRQSIDRYFVLKMFRRQYVPALAAAFTLSIGDVADALVLGNRMGLTGLAAIALVMPVGMVFNVIMNALGIGGSVAFSRRMAQGQENQARDGFQGVVLTAFTLGILFAAGGNLLAHPLLRILGASPRETGLYQAALLYLRILLLGAPAMFLNYVLNYYLKNDNMEREAGLAFSVGNLCDVTLNIVLVLVLDLGAAGASLATIAGQTVGMIISVVSILRHDDILRLDPLHPDFQSVGAEFRTGFAAAVGYLYNTFFLTIANNLLIRMAGDAGVAVFDVVLNVSYFAANLDDAAVKSALPVISTYDGEHNAGGKRLALKMALWACLAADLLLCALLWLLPGGVCAAFGLRGAHAVEMGNAALRIYALSLPFGGICVLLENYYEACQKERETYVLSTLRGAAVLLPATLICAAFGLPRFWLLYPVTGVLTLLLFAPWVRRFGTRQELSEERIYRKTIYSRSAEISETCVEIEEFCERWAATIGQQYFVAMSVEEICVAIMDTAFGGREDGFIQITLIVTDDHVFELHMRDNASFFNPFSLETEKASAASGVNLDALGVMAIKKKARDFYYRNYQGFNTIIFRI